MLMVACGCFLLVLPASFRRTALALLPTTTESDNSAASLAAHSTLYHVHVSVPTACLAVPC